MSHQEAIPLFAGGVIDPLSKNDFFEQYWEQKPLHIARTSSENFQHLISEHVIESLLSTHSLAYPSVQLSKTGHVIPIESYTDANQFIVSERIIEQYKSGSTVVMSLAHKIHPPLMQFCREVQAGFGFPCQTNVYLSPPGNQGFNPHHDTHDVFILQVSGKKTFSFYDGGAQLPTSADRFDSKVHSVGEKTEEIALNAGDTLYIPRGFVHDARADSFDASLHITLGVYPVLMHTLINRILANASRTDVRLRASVLNSTDAAISTDSTDTEQAKQILEDHINENSMAEALANLLDENALDAKQDLAGQLSAITRSQVSKNSQLMVRRLAVINISRVGSTLTLRTHGAVLTVNDPMGRAIEWCLKQSPEQSPEQSSVQIDQMPGLTSDQQVALAEQLVACGVLYYA